MIPLDVILADQQNLKRDFKNYLDGFSENIRNITYKFNFYEQIPRLVEPNRLGLLIEKFCDSRINLSNKPVLHDDGTEKFEALDNHSMGTLFEEVIRMFNEHTNVTNVGRQFKPRDMVQFMADLAFIPIQFFSVVKKTLKKLLSLHVPICSYKVKISNAFKLNLVRRSQTINSKIKLLI